MFTSELQKEVQEQFYTTAFLVSVYKEFKRKVMEFEKNGDVREYQRWSGIASSIFELIGGKEKLEE